MRRSIANPPHFTLASEAGGHIVLTEPHGAIVHIFVLEEDIIRVAVLPDGKWRMPKTWSIAPGLDDVAAEGRARMDMSGFTCPTYTKRAEGHFLTIETKRLQLGINLGRFSCRWKMKQDDEWVEIARDRWTQAYNFSWWDDRVYHYLARAKSERYFGLGEVSGDTDRHGRHIRLSNTDALGYDARTSHPLYKHIPFYITHEAETNAAFGLFYDTLADCAFDFGCEISNYHLSFRSFKAEHGDLDFYVIAGPAVADVTRRFTWLTGRPAFMPAWSLGYSGSTMSYTDAPDAQQQMNTFLAKCAEHDILCQSFHLSSGYTSIGFNRYVFNWNREKFPDPEGFVRHYANHGVRLAPNIKPAMLTDHPLYEHCAREGFFIKDEAGEPAQFHFWGAHGAHIDFTNPRAVLWWKARVTEALLDLGMAATWNDNNECEVRDATATAAFFGDTRPAIEAKPAQTLLMVKASREAQLARTVEKRPYVVTRSGVAGMQRYAQTWSGDNPTAWETLKYNIKMGLGMSLSGFSNIGHDVGGFAGPAPDAELFLRWVECGIFFPRFSIHSWNDDGTVNEPWMHSNVTPHVRDLIKFRARLSPYLYDLMWRSHQAYEPISRPTFFDFPNDARCLRENDEMMLGASLLVAPVVEPGVSERTVYLPKGADWYDFWRGTFYEGGREVTVPAPLGTPPFFVRAGSAIAANVAEQHFAKPADERGFYVFPPRGAGSFVSSTFEDDGESFGYQRGQFAMWNVAVDAAADRVKVNVTHNGSFGAMPKSLKLIFPVAEQRKIEANGRIASDVRAAEGRVVTLETGA